MAFVESGTPSSNFSADNYSASMSRCRIMKAKVHANNLNLLEVNAVMAKQQSKEQHEKHQAILSRLLKDEDNKYCVDCDAKGPRWASWNLGIFLCIRCAGIHRNLGVHISKVKSINLDSWTAEQIAMVEDMGNSRARAVYEANLPDNYKRPSTSDSAMEQFIRAKYEHKKYIAKEWVPPKPRSVPSHYYDTEKETKKETKRQTKTVLTIPGAAAGTTAAKSAASKTEKTTPAKQEVSSSAAANQPSLMVDLNSPAKQANGLVTKPSTSTDLLADIFSSPSAQAQASTAGSNDLLGLSTASPAGQIQSNGTTQQNSGEPSQDLFKAAEEKSQSTKDSIMALFGNSAPQPQQNMMHNSFTMQGSYTQQQPQQQNMMYTNPQMMQQGMMNSYQMPQQQPNMTAQQAYYQQGMMANPQQGMIGIQQPQMMGNPQQGMMGNPQQGMMGMPQQGYYNQQQQMFASQQLQAQMANMSMNQQQQNIPQKTAMTTGSSGASWGSGSQTNGQTLNFDLWN